MSAIVAELLSILDLEPLEVNLFRGPSQKTAWRRVFGGQVIAQALVAASRTVETRAAHSLHGYFLLGGDPEAPIVYEVERIRDGRSFATRRVVAIQHGRPIFTMSASFHADEPGLEQQLPMPDVPGPEGLASDIETKERLLAAMPEPARRYFARERPIEMRPVEYDRYGGVERPDGRFHLWIKAAAPLPDDPAIHRAVLAYASDMTLLDTSLVRLGRTLFEPEFMAASLDHALWLHRPFRADKWLLYAQDSPNLGGSRGFSRGSVFTQEGLLVASVAQEGLVRLRTR